jgi:hypothetical protein
MPQPHQPSAYSPQTGCITPVTCQHCGADAHLAQMSPHPELNAELRTFVCDRCGKQTELIVLQS